MEDRKHLLDDFLRILGNMASECGYAVTIEYIAETTGALKVYPASVPKIGPPRVAVLFDYQPGSIGLQFWEEPITATDITVDMFVQEYRRRLRPM